MTQTISDIQLNAMIDGQLDERDAEEILNLMQSDPELRERYETFRAQKAEIREFVNNMTRSDNGATELIVGRLERRLQLRRFASRFRLAAAALVIFAVGFTSQQAFKAGGELGGNGQMEELLADAAQTHAMLIASKSNLHQFLTIDAERAIDVMQRQSGTRIALPDARREGLTPVGALIVPVRRGAGIEMVYTDFENHLVTLFVASAAANGAPIEVPPRLEIHDANVDGINLAYWRHGNFVYTMAGEIPPEVLHLMASAMANVAPTGRFPF
jgi:anti-sigma factor RsiW